MPTQWNLLIQDVGKASIIKQADNVWYSNFFVMSRMISRITTQMTSRYPRESFCHSMGRIKISILFMCFIDVLRFSISFE